MQAALAHAPVYEVASTGAKVTLENASLLLHAYVSRLPADQYTTLRPLYRTEQTGMHSFATRVFLPNNCPLPWADGAQQAGRKPAIAAAALQACRLLHQVRGGAGRGGWAARLAGWLAGRQFTAPAGQFAVLRPVHVSCCGD